jgi:hypothetical protein
MIRLGHMRVAHSRNVLAILVSIFLLSPQLALAQSCTMTLDKNPVAPGEGTYLRWNVGDPNGSIYADMGGAGGYMNTGYSGFFINDLGMTLANNGNAINLANIGGSTYYYSGKVWVAPYQTTTYTGSAGFTIPDCWAYDGTQQSCPSWYPSCSAILYVEGGSQSPVPAVAPATPPPPRPPPPPATTSAVSHLLRHLRSKSHLVRRHHHPLVVHRRATFLHQHHRLCR